MFIYWWNMYEHQGGLWSLPAMIIFLQHFRNIDAMSESPISIWCTMRGCGIGKNWNISKIVSYLCLRTIKCFYLWLGFLIYFSAPQAFTFLVSHRIWIVSAVGYGMWYWMTATLCLIKVLLSRPMLMQRRQMKKRKVTA